MIVDVGRYTVRSADSPMEISQRLYGDRHKVKKLLLANPTSTFQPGEVIDVPEFTGVVLVAEEGDQFPTLFRRAFKNPAAMQSAKVEFMKWNGTTMVEEGDSVFFVDLRKKTYGY